ncbi:hypothetical protein VTK26DRAFT_9023 [Humicola hyalothermophila]
MASKHRISVRAATPADVDAISDVNFAAFDDNVMNKLMYPNGITDELREKNRERFMPALVKDDKPEDKKKGQELLYVAEYWPPNSPADAPGEIIAMAKWTLYREPRTEEEWKADDFKATAERFGQGSNLAFIDAFIGGLNSKTQSHVKGDPHLHLGVLACRPDRQGLGAGTALLRWGLDLADSLGIPTHLEASPAGYPLYRKFGFEDIDVLDLDLARDWGMQRPDGKDWGANIAVELVGPAPEGVSRSGIMRRPARKTGAEEPPSRR